MLKIGQGDDISEALSKFVFKNYKDQEQPYDNILISHDTSSNSRGHKMTLFEFLTSEERS